MSLAPHFVSGHELELLERSCSSAFGGQSLSENLARTTSALASGPCQLRIPMGRSPIIQKLKFQFSEDIGSGADA